MLATLAWLIMVTPGIISVFYLILFPAGVSDTHPEIIKLKLICSAKESDILFGIAQ